MDDRHQTKTRRRVRGVALALLVVAASALLVNAHFHLRHPEAHGFAIAHLWWFDAYVYLSMAENPATFTVAPWGYRVLVPWLAHVAHPEKPLRSFRHITLGALAAAGALLFLFLRRLGFGWWACWLGLIAFSVSTPVGEALKNPFVVDGVGIALALAFLVGLQAGVGVLPLLVSLALGMWTKDLFLAFVPLLVIPLRRRLSLTRAVAVTVLVGLVALSLPVALRAYWTPHIATPRPALGTHLIPLFIQDVRSVAGPRAALATLLGGLLPLALVGAVTRVARPFLVRYGYLAILTFAVPYLAWMNVPDTRPFGFLGDVPRLHIYALPFLIPLALIGLGRLVPRLAPHWPPDVPRGVAASPLVTGLAVAVLAATVCGPFLLVDRYQRVALHARRDGMQILLTCRHTLTVAERLRRGETVVLPVEPHESLAPRDPRRWRWFLYGPWPDDVYTGDSDLRLANRPAALLIPTLEPATLEVGLRLVGAAQTAVALDVNGTPVGRLRVGTVARTRKIRLPAAALLRGDNVLTLAPRDPGVKVVIEGVTLRPVAGGSPKVATRPPGLVALAGLLHEAGRTMSPALDLSPAVRSPARGSRARAHRGCGGRYRRSRRTGAARRMASRAIPRPWPGGA